MKRMLLAALLALPVVVPAEARMSTIEFAQAENFADSEAKMIVAMGIICKIEEARTFRIAFLESLERSNATEYQISKLDDVMMSDVPRMKRCPLNEDQKRSYRETVKIAIKQMEEL